MSKFTSAELMGKTVVELRNICTNLNIPGMSKKRKDVIINAILDKTESKSNFTYDELKEKTNNELRNICNTLGIAGVSKKTKDVLVELIMNKKVESPVKESKDNEPKKILSKNPLIYNPKYGDIIPETAGVINTTDKQLKIRISCGAKTGEFGIKEGYTVGHVISNYKVHFNVDSMADVTVNGRPAKLDYIMKAGDELEFVKKAGSKSC